MSTFNIKILGCKVSRYDAERIANFLEEFGFEATEDKPDLYILNGCSVTSRASQKVRQILRAAKRKWPKAKIVLAGCEARLRQQQNIVTNEADAVLTDTYSKQALYELLLSLGFCADCNDKNNEKEKANRKIVATEQTRAFLKIQDGCNQFCSYCIVPYLRGEEWSKKIEDAVKETEKLVNEGHKEIVLTGIHIGHFKPSLIELVKELEKVKGLERIRISSIESVEVSDELIKWVAESKKACSHFHLPLQSGCNRILKAMKRPYNTEDFKKIVNRIRNADENIAVSTDLIVGFPGETDEDFNETLNFLKEIQFSRIHIFRYSKRKGTPAAEMPNQISNAVKHERALAVEQIWHESAKKFHKKFINRQLEILWETYKDGYWHGFSREYIPCIIKSSKELHNKITVSTGVRLNDKLELEVT